MTVSTYEAMFLIDSNKYASDPEGTLGDVTRILERVEAETLASRPWQDGKLAYPVEGRRKALHYLTYIRMEGHNLSEMTRLCKLSPIVLRHLIIKLDSALVEPMLAVATGETPKPAEEVADKKPEVAVEATEVAEVAVEATEVATEAAEESP